MTIKFPFLCLQPSYFSISQRKWTQNFVTLNNVCCFTIIVVIKTCLLQHAGRCFLCMYGLPICMGVQQSVVINHRGILTSHFYSKSWYSRKCYVYSQEERGMRSKIFWEHSNFFSFNFSISCILIRHLFKYTNPMNITRLIHIYTTLLLHVSAYFTRLSGRIYVFITPNHPPLQSYSLRYTGCAI